VAADHALLRGRFLELLNGGDFPALLRLCAPIDDGHTALLGYERLAAMWRELHHEGRRGVAVFLGDLTDDATAATALHLFLARRPEQPHVRVVRTVRQTSGWQLAPALIDLEAWPVPGDAAAQGDPLAVRVTDSLPGWQAGTSLATVAGVEQLGGLPAGPAPSGDQAAAAVRAWRAALLGGDLAAAARAAAIFGQAKSGSRFLRMLGHELVGVRRTPDPGEVIAAGSHGRWAAASLRIDTAEAPSFQFFAVVSGAGGAKVLPEIDLFHQGGRTRQFLNQTTWGELRMHLPGPAVDELRALFDRHERIVEQAARPTPTATRPE
jgi:hypothetical protein